MRGEVEVVKRLGVIAAHADTLGVHRADVKLRLGAALLRRLGEVVQRLLLVSFHSKPRQVHVPEAKLSVGVTLLRGRLEQPDRRRVVRPHPQPVGEQVPQLRHGVRVSRRRRLGEVPVRSSPVSSKALRAGGEDSSDGRRRVRVSHVRAVLVVLHHVALPRGAAVAALGVRRQPRLLDGWRGSGRRISDDLNQPRRRSLVIQRRRGARFGHAEAVQVPVPHGHLTPRVAAHRRKVLVRHGQRRVFGSSGPSGGVRESELLVRARVSEFSGAAEEVQRDGVVDVDALARLMRAAERRERGAVVRVQLERLAEEGRGAPLRASRVRAIVEEARRGAEEALGGREGENVVRPGVVDIHVRLDDAPALGRRRGVGIRPRRRGR